MYSVSPPENQYIFLASFGIGVILMMPIFTLSYLFVLFRCFEERIEINLRFVSIAGLVSGFIWNIGNWGSIFATVLLGLACGFPLSYTFIVITGLWKVYFSEISGFKSTGLYIFSACLLIGGASLLGAYARHP